MKPQNNNQITPASQRLRTEGNMTRTFIRGLVSGGLFLGVLAFNLSAQATVPPA